MHLPQLGTSRIQAVLDLAEAAHRADGSAPLNEHTLLHLPDPGDASRHLVCEDGDRLFGYAYVDLSGDAAASGECVVHPDARGAGLGRALVGAALAAAGERPLEMWAHGDLPAAAAVAGHTGMRRVRELLRMRRELEDPLPPVAFPDRMQVRTFQPGSDDEAWLALNARVFAAHPEQGALTPEDLRVRMQQQWFDPAGFFLAARDGELLGFHWTKVHVDQTPLVGEVYVVGVSPEAQGGGLGRALTLQGLHHLRDAGLASVLLYVEADNTPARQVYERLGFRVDSVDVQYRS